MLLESIRSNLAAAPGSASWQPYWETNTVASSARFEMAQEYRPFAFDEVRDLLAGVPGMPPSATVLITGAVFVTMPMPAQRRSVITGGLNTLKKDRAWAEASGATDRLDTIDKKIEKLRKKLKPKVPLVLDPEGVPSRMFLSFADLGESKKKAIALDAFIVMAMDILLAHGLVLKRTGAEETAALRKGALSPTALEVLCRILDALGWVANRPGRQSATDAQETSRTPKSMLVMYQRSVDRLSKGALSVAAYDGKHAARLPTPEELTRFASLAFPGRHGTPEAEWLGGRPPRVWLSVKKAA